MTLLERRRAMMGSKSTEERWDFILLPDANGLITRTAFYDYPAGTKITIEWDATGYDGATGRYVFRTSLASAYRDGSIMMERDLPTTTGRMRFTLARDAEFAFGGYSGQNTNRFMGRYLKIRIN